MPKKKKDNVIEIAFSFLTKAINYIPFLKGYRTFIQLGILGISFCLDQSGVGPGNIYDSIAPYLWPTTSLTALAHYREK